MTIQDLISYNSTGAQPFDRPQSLKPMPFCNGFIATNTGDTTVTVNGHILYPGVAGVSNGDAFVYGGNVGEVYHGNITLFFGAGANPEVTIDQKYYNFE